MWLTPRTYMTAANRASAAFPRRSFECDHSPVPADSSRGQQRVQAVMRAHVQHRYSRTQQLLHESGLRRFEFVVHQIVIQRAFFR
jgi:hypothetical protein